ncbi:hypothetical protein HY945_01275, partial [Candidatus Gottesmanbacteria bacterium]|nr:hypothetical protein [Candidatus Gottesmanbacteria bacterium]
MMVIREIRKFEKKMKEGEKAEKERQEAEKQEKRDEEKRKREAEEQGRPYHQIRSGEEAVETEEQYKNLEVAQVEQALSEFLNNFHNGQQPGEDVKWTGAGYIYDYLSSDTTRRDRLMDLVRANPVAGEVVRALINPKSDVHSDPGELLKLGQRLVFQADKAGRMADVAGLVNLIKG